MPGREAMEFNAPIVGAGPTRLAAAIRLKQATFDATLCVVENGSEAGAHIAMMFTPAARGSEPKKEDPDERHPRQRVEGQGPPPRLSLG
ncbi:hypothetical protein [Roseomonas gilardii]|uniref:hypothetical protein n=1 Tax=Roseomonas gilardii TaxID=257708 RepID=UPI0012EBD96F|nr:hypothetical protein [Roseomonas gilardii]